MVLRLRQSCSRITDRMTDAFTRNFDTDGRLTVPASTMLRQRVRMLRRLPARPPRSLDQIPETRRNFDVLIAGVMRAVPAEAREGVRSTRIEADGVALQVAEPERRPGEPPGAVLHIHGGGWCVGDAAGLRPALEALARRTGALVASVEYRLAPEHPHPAAADDCERAAIAWLETLHRRGHPADASRLVLAGESAGAHLALLTLQRLRERGLRPAGALLTYGLFDLANGRPSRRVQADGGPLLDDGACAFYVDAYLGAGARRDDPAVSPWHWPPKRLAGMPPALFCVGGLDPLHDDSVDLHARWRQAGNEAWLAVYQGAPHAFDLFGTPEAAHMAELQTQFIRRCLAG